MLLIGIDKVSNFKQTTKGKKVSRYSFLGGSYYGGSQLALPPPGKIRQSTPGRKISRGREIVKFQSKATPGLHGMLSCISGLSFWRSTL